MSKSLSLIADHQNRATVRWWDSEFAPLLKRLGFKAKTCETILKLTDPEVARREPFPAWTHLDVAKLRQLGHAARSSQLEILINA